MKKLLLFSILALSALSSITALDLKPSAKFSSMGAAPYSAGIKALGLTPEMQKDMVSSIKHTNSDIPVRYALGKDARDKITVLKHCKLTADKINLPEVSFNLDKQAFGYSDATAGGCYDHLSKTIWLSPRIQKMIIQDKVQRAIGLGSFALLHEFGHHFDFSNNFSLLDAIEKETNINSSKDELIKKERLASEKAEEKLRYRLETIANTAIGLQSVPEIIGLSLMATLYMSTEYMSTEILHKQFHTSTDLPVITDYQDILNELVRAREKYADRFATEKLCELHGFDKTQKILQELKISWPKHGKGAESDAGYQTWDSLLAYSKKLQSRTNHTK